MFKPAIMLLTLLLVCPAWGGGQDGQLLERLRVDRGALQAAERDFLQHQQQGNLGATESREYAAYVDRLRQRVVRDCAALAVAEIVVPANLDCPQQTPPIAGPAAIDQASEQTDAERAAALDAELNAELGEFDQRLLREQERVKAARPPAAGGGSQGDAGSAAEGAEGGRSGDLADGGEPGVTGEPGETGDLAVPPTASGAAGGPGQQTTIKDQPKDVPDGSDDDVVARQLREAAQRETDPELKKKLWEEYRKYKQGTL
jgi:hypothetical protein